MRPELSLTNKSPTLRYKAAFSREAPPNLWTSHGLGLLLGEVTLAGQLSSVGMEAGGGLLKETARGSSLLLVGWVRKKEALLFHGEDGVLVSTPLWWRCCCCCLEGVKAATLTKGAAKRM